MKTLKEFEYDLWTSKDAAGKHYWARVKATGESCELSLEVMKELRNIEKRMRREYLKTNSQGGSDLSYDTVPVDDETSIWLIDPTSSEDSILFNLYFEDFRSLLTPVQLTVLNDCLLADISIHDYAKAKGLAFNTVYETVKAIRKKYKKYFF